MNQAEYYRTRWAWLVLLACLLAGSGARAGVLPLMGRMADAAGHMERLVDPQGTLDAAGAAQAPGWVALPASLG
ncbi:hypothetical protein LWS69_16635, partial [Bordetella hinzii]|nr:hypothetical protein [Bordetella hinzii]